VDPDRLLSVGYGDTRPIASNTTNGKKDGPDNPAGREQHRRAGLTFSVLEVEFKRYMEQMDVSYESAKVRLMKTSQQIPGTMPEIGHLTIPQRTSSGLSYQKSFDPRTPEQIELETRQIQIKAERDRLAAEVTKKALAAIVESKIDLQIPDNQTRNAMNLRVDKEGNSFLASVYDPSTNRTSQTFWFSRDGYLVDDTSVSNKLVSTGEIKAGLSKWYQNRN